MQTSPGLASFGLVLSAGPQRNVKKDEHAEDWKVRCLVQVTSWKRRRFCTLAVDCPISVSCFDSCKGILLDSCTSQPEWMSAQLEWPGQKHLQGHLSRITGSLQKDSTGVACQVQGQECRQGLTHSDQTGFFCKHEKSSQIP